MQALINTFLQSVDIVYLDVDLIVFRLDLQLHLLFPTEKQSVLHVCICFRRK